MDRYVRRQRVAGGILILGVVYLVFEAIAAAAWVDPPYDWARNLISDLGFADCAVVDGDRLCSPLHPLMNAGFMVQGTVFTAGSIVIVPLMLARNRLKAVVLALLIASGVGTFFVGVFHQSLALEAAGLNWLHVLAAVLAIAAGNLGITLLGALLLRSSEWRAYAIAILFLGVLGTASALLLVARVDFGLGLGLVERVAVYPLNGWTIGTAVGLLVKAARDSVRWSRARPVPTIGT